MSPWGRPFPQMQVEGKVLSGPDETTHGQNFVLKGWSSQEQTSFLHIKLSHDHSNFSGGRGRRCPSLHPL